MKIFRWTIGDVSQIGISILEKSIIQAKKNLLKFNFNFYVCLNFSDNNKAVEKICLDNKIEIIKTNWDSFPLPKEIIPKEYNLNSLCGIPRGRQGSFWKLCPPRLEINSYEIVCDNDIIIQNCPNEIEEFLNCNKTLISEENVYSLGKYTKYISKPYNSGLYGFPPNYNFGAKIFKKWEETGCMQPLLSRDEQGIIILTLKSEDYIEIPKEKTCFVFDQGEAIFAKYEIIKENGFDSQIVKEINYKKSELKKDILHFLGANRSDTHFYWEQYKLKRILI